MADLIIPLEDHVKAINEIALQHVFEGFIKIGNYVLQHFFSNKIEDALSRNPKKMVSFNNLAEHPDLKIDKRRLSEMVRIAAQETKLPSSEKLKYSHKLQLLRLPYSKKDKMVTFAKDVIKHDWTVKELRKNIDNYLDSTHRDPSSYLKLKKAIKELEHLKEIEIFIPDVDTIDTGKSTDLIPKAEEAIVRSQKWLEIFQKNIKELQDFIKSMKDKKPEIEVKEKKQIERVPMKKNK